MPAADPRYVAARRVLLDALEALGPHRAALILVGAQAVYLRSTTSSLQIAPYTTDADLALDPDRLDDHPPMEALLEAAGFRRAGPDRVGSWLRSVEIEGRDDEVQVDLMVPAAVAAGTGRRSVALPGHDAKAARKTTGLEAALVDRSPLTIAALDDDPRAYVIQVAGPGALLVAKVHKIVERLADRGRRDRTSDKDAADLFRLMQGTPPVEMAHAVGAALREPASARVTRAALDDLRPIFGRRGGAGIQMAIAAIGAGIEEGATMEAVAVAYVDRLLQTLAELEPQIPG